eukprot:COSAG02_NODE_1154_length_14189_cov_10.515614_5_plen_63_part_00
MILLIRYYGMERTEPVMHFGCRGKKVYDFHFNAMPLTADHFYNHGSWTSSVQHWATFYRIWI